MKKEYCSMTAMVEYRDAGRIENNIFEPSRGGIGTKLKKAKAKFVITIEEVIT